MRAGASTAVSVERFFQASLLGMAASGFLALAGSGYLDAATLAVMAVGLVWRAFILAGMAGPELPRRAGHPRHPRRLRPGRHRLRLAFARAARLHPSLGLLSGGGRKSSPRAPAGITWSRPRSPFWNCWRRRWWRPTSAFSLLWRLYLLFAMGALMSAEIRRSLARPGGAAVRGGVAPPPLPSRLAAMAVFASTGILALTAGLFFLLPRTADAAFSHLISHRLHLPGFASEIRLGEIGEIKTSSRPVMHIHLWGPGARRPEVAGRHARGVRRPALVEFRRRTRDPLAHRGEADLTPPGAMLFRHGINYDITYDEISTDALFFAGEPRSIRVRALRLERVEGGYRLPRTPVPGLPLRRLQPAGGTAGDGHPALPAPGSVPGRARALAAASRARSAHPGSRRPPHRGPAQRPGAGPLHRAAPPPGLRLHFATARPTSPPIRWRIFSSRARKATANTSPPPWRSCCARWAFPPASPPDSRAASSIP